MDDSRTIRILLVSRHALLRGALAHLLQVQPGLEVVGEVGNRLQAVTEAGAHAPDVILLEPDAVGEIGLDAIGPLVAAAGRHARVLVLTANPDPDLPGQALRHGARGLIDLIHPPQALFKAIEAVQSGDVWMERRVVADLLNGVSHAPGAAGTRVDSLTPREREVVRLVSEGLKNKQIAERLSVADVTVRHHLTSIFSKLNVADRLSLVVFAYRCGLAEPPARWHTRA
jgi:DNA-binding NarL/FixJ family response regulator